MRDDILMCRLEKVEAIIKEATETHTLFMRVAVGADNFPRMEFGETFATLLCEWKELLDLEAKRLAWLLPLMNVNQIASDCKRYATKEATGAWWMNWVATGL